MPSWGDLNARLNRLVRQGVISGFRTNLASRPDPASLTIAVVPGAAAPKPPGSSTSAEALRAWVSSALSGIAPQATITVEEQHAAGPER